jgi:hypothetical protein
VAISPKFLVPFAPECRFLLFFPVEQRIKAQASRSVHGFSFSVGRFTVTGETDAR